MELDAPGVDAGLGVRVEEPAGRLPVEVPGGFWPPMFEAVVGGEPKSDSS